MKFKNCYWTGFILMFALTLMTSSVPSGNATSAQATVMNSIPRAQGFQELELAVTPEGFDDIGYILTGLGYPYDDITLADLEDATLLSGYDVIFMNCAGGFDFIAESAGPVIKSYVEGGGVVYASDWAYPVIDDAFDDAINFYDEEEYLGAPEIGSVQTVTVNVVDPGFAAYIGSSTITVDFDLPGWVVMESVAGTTTQHLAGTVQTDVGAMSVPITVSFERGEGSVIYTSFHYEAQGPLAERLMEYLVFKAVTETVAATVEGGLKAEGYSIAYDIRGSINQDDTTNFNVTIDELTDVKVVLDWYGSVLGLSAQTPAGATLSSSGTKPKYIEIPSASVGTYVVSVAGDEVPTENEPFVLMVGVSEEAEGVGEIPWLYVGIGVVVVAFLILVAMSMRRRAHKL